MSKYEANITANKDGSFYALIVRIDSDGESNVIHGYKGRHFTTFARAANSTRTYINKHHSDFPVLKRTFTYRSSPAIKASDLH